MDPGLARAWGVQVAHSLNMIAELPPYVDDNTVPMALRVAAIDAFFVHLRNLSEFLVKPWDRRLIHRRSYASDFHLDEALRSRLLANYELASRHVGHFNAERVPAKDSSPHIVVTGAQLRGHADDVFDAMEAFVKHLAAKASEHAVDFREWLARAKARRVD